MHANFFEMSAKLSQLGIGSKSNIIFFDIQFDPDEKEYQLHYKLSKLEINTHL